MVANGRKLQSRNFASLSLSMLQYMGSREEYVKPVPDRYPTQGADVAQYSGKK
jgi:hypothetical protein